MGKRRYIVQIQIEENDPSSLQDFLSRYEIEMDEDYGLVPLDPARRTAIVRVLANEDALVQAAQSRDLAFYPDLAVGSFASTPPGDNEKG